MRFEEPLLRTRRPAEPVAQTLHWQLQPEDNSILKVPIGREQHHGGNLLISERLSQVLEERIRDRWSCRGKKSREFQRLAIRFRPMIRMANKK